MCISKQELSKKVSEYHSMKALLDETQAIIDALKFEIVDYMKANQIDTEITADGKVTYKDSSRSSFDEKLLKSILGTDDLKQYKKVSTFKVLRISWGVCDEGLWYIQSAVSQTKKDTAGGISLQDSNIQHVYLKQFACARCFKVWCKSTQQVYLIRICSKQQKSVITNQKLRFYSFLSKTWEQITEISDNKSISQ